MPSPRQYIERFLVWLRDFGNGINLGVTSAEGGYPKEPRDVIGLGLSYNWMGMDPAELAEAIAESGCNSTDIEIMGSTSGLDFYARANGYNTMRPKYLDLLKECRKRNVLLIVSIVNDNGHIKKWLNTGVNDLLHFPAEHEAAAEMVLKAGPKGQWVQPVAETQTRQGRDFQRRWVARFNAAGFRTINNDGSRPPHNGMCWTRAYHACDLSDLGNGTNILCIPDCGTAIDAYTDGGNFNSGHTVNPKTAADYALRCRKKGNGCSIYTGTGIRDLDKQIPAINEIGRLAGVGKV